MPSPVCIVVSGGRGERSATVETEEAVMLPWVREGYESHEGTADVRPAGADESSASTRGRCTCGWRGEHTYAVDGDDSRAGARPTRGTPGPKRDWEAHMDLVAARAVPLPDDVAALLDELRARLDTLLDHAPLTALKAADALQGVVASTGPVAALFVSRAAEVLPMARIAELLGMTEQAAGSRLAHYRQLNR
ncbi:hypothetical protein ACGF1Z_01300 [Streptomyces sp. NPDC048018]|uniref:hypothetical protein n=1 Tax=Streptomyces sp. NPDC048018 TaxID=3365499 RepID=UPI0037105ADC